MYEDKTITCRDCGEEFIFSAGEQEFYERKGYTNAPVRCKACREARKNGEAPVKRERQYFEAVCAECGGPARIPFRPTGDRPVYCSHCFDVRSKRDAQGE